MSQIVDFLNRVIWNPLLGPFSLLAFLLLGVGVYLTVRTRGAQFRLFGHMLATLRASMRHTDEGVSGFQAFATSLASRVGVGNIVGVATALAIGGPGAIFWMWVVALVGMVTSLVESTLAQVYKVADEGDYRGGPAYYTYHGLGSRGFGGVMAVLTIAAYVLAFGPIQSNAMSSSLANLAGAPQWASGVGIAVVSAAVILGGIHRIARFAELVVPIMSVAYVLLALVVVVLNLDEVPVALAAIVAGAFGAEQLAGGLTGAGLSLAMQFGVARGLFSNEAGLGTVPNAAGAAKVPHPVTQGLAQGFGVFVDTLVICTATALMILLSGAYGPNTTEEDAATLTADAMRWHFGDLGADFVSVALLFFAFSSIVAFGYFIENNAAFLGAHRRVLLIVRLLFIGMLFAGAVRSLSAVWESGDAFLGLLGICNLVVIAFLSRGAIRLLADYEEQRRSGVRTPAFDRTRAGLLLRGSIDPQAWPEGS